MTTNIKHKDSHDMQTGHIFAGAGGGILADLILGHSPTWAIEQDPYCCAVLRERFPHLQVVCGDVREVDFSRLGRVDAICGGFPCQDISVAGSGAGITGSRSSLFSEIMRAADTIRPDWIFLENSPNIRTKGRHIVIAELVARGYSWRDGILAASDVGAPHQRKRWWCLARRNVPDMLRQGLSLPRQNQNGAHGEQIRRQSTASNWWATEPDLGRVAHGVANRTHRIKALGNGQVPLCAAVAWKLLGGP